ncbi:hypothetical protein DPMN_050343 [Dreissena polymorpha]|uniref:Uncharacterized protein n=1 Tax=Dreissena polymorpha TaxID=45954 RepID=A0A9D4HM73_DREPO|nr:hypothetical protein DPMN_050343 [Dreissena polymorpha]
MVTAHSATQPSTTLYDCQDPPVLQNGFRNAISTTYNATVIYSCNNGYTMFGESSITCLDTGNWSELLVNCTINDIDECLKRNTCHYNANCTNTDGSFKCECQNGYRDQVGVGGQRCADVDECAFDGDFFCMHALNQTRVCVNIDGGYVCVCNKGLTGSKCETDIIECNDTTTCGPHADCTNTHGGYSCACPDGYPQGNSYLGCFDCQDPPVLQNVFRNATSTTYNATVIYSCNNGYTMFGENCITCLDTGNWSDMLFNCVIKDCQNPPVLQDGYQNATSTTYNSTVIYSCKPGYRMIGDNSITCLNTGTGANCW